MIFYEVINECDDVLVECMYLVWFDFEVLMCEYGVL